MAVIQIRIEEPHKRTEKSNQIKQFMTNSNSTYLIDISQNEPNDDIKRDNQKLVLEGELSLLRNEMSIYYDNHKVVDTGAFIHRGWCVISILEG